MSIELPTAPAGCATAAGLQRHTLNGPTMGTRYAAVFFAPSNINTTPVGAALQAAVDRVDAQMSTWKPDSDLSRFNRAICDQWVDIPGELAKVIAAALEIGTASDGAFDIGVGDLTDAWGFGPAGTTPDLDRIGQLGLAPPRAAADLLELDRAPGRLRKRGAVSLDLSGIAKGFGVDELARVLDDAGIRDYLVSIDGELRASGLKPDGKSWAIAVERPLRDSRDASGVLELTDQAVATSGDYRHWVEVDGREWSHTMDPRTRQPLANRLASVTVIADDCMQADAWATALMVLGEIDGPKLAASRKLDAVFVVRGSSEFEETPVGRFSE